MERELQEIQDYLEEPLSDVPERVMERGAKLSVYLARAGRMSAQAKALYNKALNEEIMKIIEKVATQAGVSHTTTNALVKSAAYREQLVYERAEKAYKECVHQLDWCRSVLSYHKEEMRMQHFGV